MKGAGKRFEDRFRKSLPQNAFVMRINDKVYYRNGRIGSEESEADFFMQFGDRSWLYECKATAEKRLPFKNVAEHQEKSLLEFDSQSPTSHGMLAVEFYDKNRYKKGYRRMFLMPIRCWMDYKRSTSRASMPISEFEKLGTECGDSGSVYSIPLVEKHVGLPNCRQCAKMVSPESQCLANPGAIGWCEAYSSFVGIDESACEDFFEWR